MRLIKKITCVFIGAFILVIGLFISVTVFMGSVFNDSYQSVIQTKYDYLMEVNEPKIVLVGGSNLAFGIDQDLMEQRLGMPVVNTGLHAGFGQRFNTDLALANINEGDIVVLAYEYGWFNEDGFSKFGSELVMSGIDDRVDLYKHVSGKFVLDLIGEFPNYSIKKVNEKTKDKKQVSGMYSSHSFDEKGNMVFERIGHPLKETSKFTVTLDEGLISEESKKYLKDIKKKVEAKDARIYFTFPSFFDEMMIEKNSMILGFPDEIYKETGIEVISDVKDYLFSSEYIYDTVYHLNSKGAALRSQRLSDDIAIILN